MSESTGNRTRLQPRTAARISAVQGLYQMDMAGTDISAVIQQIGTVRFDDQDGPGEEIRTDRQFFADVLRGVVRRQRDIDPLIDHQLATGWRLVRVDSILRAILRAGVFELMERHDVPVKVVISEYINVAHAFFSDDEPKVVNGVLDRLARQLRAGELAAGVPDAADG